MKCANHPEKDAVSICNHCGKSICPDCQIMLKNESYCLQCQGSGAELAKKQNRSPALAAILSFIVAGLGQFYNGQPGKGIAIFLTAFLVIPWFFGIYDAYATAKKINQGKIAVKNQPGCLIAFVVFLCLSMFFVVFLGMLAAIAVPNFLLARVNANDAAAENRVKMISAAIESYKSVNGEYPAEQSSMTGTQPPFLSGEYFSAKQFGHVFSVEFKPDGYKISAHPEDCGVTAMKIIEMQSGGKLSSQPCREKE